MLAGSSWRRSNRHGDSGDKCDDKGGDNGEHSARVPAPAASSGDADVDVAVLDPTVAARLATGTVDLAEAEKIKANALALNHLLAAWREAGALVEAEAAHGAFFETMRSIRDALLGWLVRAGP